MPDPTIAERILGLVTTPDRARSIAGDLLEGASARGPFWFWSSVFRIATSQISRDLYDARLRMLWLAFIGWIECFIGGVALFNTVIPTWEAISPYMIGPNSYYIPPWGFYGLLVTVTTAVPFVVGWDVANRSKNRHLTAGFALTLMFGLLAMLEAIQHGTVVYRVVNMPYPYAQNTLLNFCGSSFCAIAGALFSRWRTTASNQPSAPLSPTV